MRVLPIVIGLLCIAIPAGVLARPKLKVAVAPLVGDAGNKIANAVVEALAGKDFAVVGPREVRREMTRLGLSDELDARTARKLASKLGVVAVIDGTVSKTSGKRSLHLEVHRRGKSDLGFTVEFKSATSKGFRRGIHDEISKKLDGAGEDPADDEGEDPKPAQVADDGDRQRKVADDEAARPARKSDDDDDRKRKLTDDDAATRRSRKSSDDGRKGKRVAAANEDGGEPAVRKRKNRKRDDEPAPQPMARVGAGGSLGQRQLSWNTRAGFTQVPPRVGTFAGAGRVDGEIYPFALAEVNGGLAGLGLAAAYDKTFGLAIQVPNRTVSAPITQSHYAIGVRYRLGIGEAGSVAVGLDYYRRRYVAERGGLMGATLDAPDVDYTAVAPGASVRVPVTSSIVAFGGADGLLILGAGAIQKSTSYGPATVYGLEGTAGVDIAIAKQIGVRVAAEYSQIMFTFNPKGSTLANNRDNDPTTVDVTGAADRSIGVAAMLCLTY